jgi:hypothetical protein
LTWFKDNEPLPASSRVVTDYNLSNCYASLKIPSALKNDLGNYLVVAENIVGRDQTSCKLFVSLQPNVDETPLINPEAFKLLDAPLAKPDEDEFKPKEHFIPPRVIVPLSNVRINEGDTVLLACKIDGYPKPKVIHK